MIEHDIPIKDKDEDALGREKFAENLARHITDYHKFSRECLIIGIQGQWGSGKTSLLNLIYNAINQEDAVCKWFNSWLSMDEQSLTQELFSIILDAYKNNCTNAEMHEMVNYFETYLKKFVQSTTFSGSVGTGKLLPNIGFKATIDGSKLIPECSETLTKQKSALVDKLSGGTLKKPIIIFIDEIDRLSENEIATLFKVIRNVADFPKVIYVLAYDRDVVESALDHVQCGHGAEYIHKIVQAAYSLPVAKPDDIRNFMICGLNEILNTIPKEMQDVEYLSIVFNSGVSKYITSLRECKRVLNSLRLKMASVGDVCDLGDMLGVTVLEHYEGRLMDLLMRHKNALCAKDEFYGFKEIEKNEAVQVYEELYATISKNHKDDALQVLAILFPHFMSITQKYAHSFRGSINMKMTNICNLECFDNYFQLCIQDEDIADTEVIYLSENANKENVFAILKKYDTEKKTKRFFERMRFLVLGKRTKFTVDSKRIFLEAVSQVVFHDYISKFELGLGLPVTSYLDWCIDAIINEDLNDEEAEKYFRNQNISLTTLLDILTIYGKGYKWVGSNEDTERNMAVVPENVFLNIELLFWDRLKEAVKSLSIINERGVVWLMNLWQRHDIKECNDFLLSIRNMPECIAKISSPYIRDGKGTEGNFMDINAKEWPLYGVITMEEAYNSAKTVIDLAAFNAWNIDVQCRIMAIKVIYERNKKDPAVVAMKRDELEQIVQKKIQENDTRTV